MDIDDLDKVLVRHILEHAQDHSWKLQDIGLLGLNLDERREYRLHVWAPSRCVAVSPLHDHPFDFVSRIIVGQLTNTRYVEDLSGVKYLRERYVPPNEGRRITDMVQLAPAEVEVYREGDEYAQLASELHDSHQVPGTVTIIRRSWRDVKELTVCRSEDAPWVSGDSRPATSAEVAEITSRTLTWF